VVLSTAAAQQGGHRLRLHPILYVRFARRDREISSALILLGQPLAAATLGIVLGVLFTLTSYHSVKLVTPEDPARGLAVFGGFMALRLLLSLGALAAYAAFVPGGLVPFGLSLAFSFVAGLTYEAVRASRLNTTRTSA
jgi:hypothetical protein